MTLRTYSAAVSLSLLFTCVALAADDPVQALAEKHGFEKIDFLLESCTFGRSKLARADREELMAMAVKPDISEKHGSTLLWIMFASLRDSADRAAEAAALTPKFEELDKDPNLPQSCRGMGHACIAFSFEQEKGGLELEQAQFEKIRKQPKEIQAALLLGLASTQWKHREERFKLLRELYADEKTAPEVRKQIIAVMQLATLQGGLPLEWCVIYYRDLAALPVTSPELTQFMFTEIAQSVNAAKILGEISRLPK